MTNNSASNRLGRFIQTSFGGENVRGFGPPALPADPPIQIETLLSKLSKADRAMGRLDGMSIYHGIQSGRENPAYHAYG